MKKYNIEMQIVYNEDEEDTVNFNLDLYPNSTVPVLAVADACIYGIVHAINVMGEGKDIALQRELLAEVLSKIINSKLLK